MIKKIIIALLLVSLMVCPSYGAYRKAKGYDSKPVGLVEIDWSHPLSCGLVGCWLMNEGAGNIVSNLVSPKTKGIGSNITWSPSLKGVLPKFNATTSVINCGNSSQLSNIFADGGTITCLIRVDGDGESATLGGLIATKNASSNNSYYLRYLNDPGGNLGDTITFVRFNTVAGFGQWRVAQNRITFGAYYIVSLSYNDLSPTSLPIVYLNGIQEKVTNTQTFSGTPGNDSANVFDIGNRSSDTTRTFNGLIGFVYLHNRVLSPSEIQQLYANPYQIFVAPKRRIISQVGGVLQKVRAFLVD